MPHPMHPRPAHVPCHARQPQARPDTPAHVRGHARRHDRWRVRAYLLVLALASAGGCATAGDTRTSGEATGAAVATGRIEGAIRHPAHVVPAMRICAIGSGAPAQARRVCIQTGNGQDRYRIDGLPPDDYVVVANATDGLYRIGGHLQQVQCIRAPCPPMPAPITLSAGAQVRDADIGHFQDRNDQLPALTSGG